jgi:hypothetical protein
VILALLACDTPEKEATPPSMQELVWLLVHDFPDESAVTEADLLGDWIDDEIDHAEEGYALEVPAQSYVDELTFDEEFDLQATAGAMVIRRMSGDMADYVATVPEPDQSFADDSYDRWDRTLTSGTEQGFIGGEELVTDDAIEKNAGFGIVLPYPMKRDYRWIELDRGSTVLTRSNIYEAGWADDSNGVVGGFTIEAWLPSDDGFIWMNATWTEVVSLVGDNEEFYQNQIIDGSTEVMEGTEAYVAAGG